MCKNLCVYTRVVELLSLSVHMSPLLGNSNCFLKWFYQTVFPPAVCESSDILHHHQHLELPDLSSKLILIDINDSLLWFCIFSFTSKVEFFHMRIICLFQQILREMCWSLQLVDLSFSLLVMSVVASCIWSVVRTL